VKHDFVTTYFLLKRSIFDKNSKVKNKIADRMDENKVKGDLPS